MYFQHPLFQWETPETNPFIPGVSHWNKLMPTCSNVRSESDSWISQNGPVSRVYAKEPAYWEYQNLCRINETLAKVSVLCTSLEHVELKKPYLYD